MQKIQTRLPVIKDIRILESIHYTKQQTQQTELKKNNKTNNNYSLFFHVYQYWYIRVFVRRLLQCPTNAHFLWIVSIIELCNYK